MVSLWAKMCTIFFSNEAFHYQQSSVAFPIALKQPIPIVNTPSQTRVIKITIVLSTFSNNIIPMQCQYFISDFEDDLIMLFQEGLSQQEIEQELCHDITGKKYLIMMSSI